MSYDLLTVLLLSLHLSCFKYFLACNHFPLSFSYAFIIVADVGCTFTFAVDDVFVVFNVFIDYTFVQIQKNDMHKDRRGYVHLRGVGLLRGPLVLHLVYLINDGKEVSGEEICGECCWHWCFIVSLCP